MADGFHLIAPKAHPMPKLDFKSPAWTLKLRQWIEAQTWLLLSSKTTTGVQLRKWLRTQNLNITPSMEPDNFDLIVHLVALGLGVSIVPRRAVAAFPRRQLLQRVSLPEEFARELVVIVPRSRKSPAHVNDFVANILFS